MVVSTAFEELTELLRCLETSDAEIRGVALREQSPESGDELTADLTVGVPVLPGVSHAAVSVEASGFEVQNQRIDVDVTVTLPTTDDASATARQHEYGAAGGTSGSAAQTSVASYKDPAALQAVYDEYDTFPEMTEALGADVTSETVRRYMVEYDIHDPTENTPQAHARNQMTPDDESLDDSTNDGEPSSEAGTETASNATGTNTRDADTPQTGPNEADTAGDTRQASSTANASEPTGVSVELGRRSVAEMIAESDSERTDDELVADGLGIPQEMTVAELAAVVNQSNTIYEVTQRLDMKQGNARRLLQKLNLIDFVIHRLAADQINVSHEEIARRIAADD